MTNYIKNYLKVYGNQLVSEKTLKYLLPIIYPDVIKEISIKQICSFYDNVDLIDNNLKNKRFDFISISNKLIIEFDGRQHFDHIEHFGTFEQFIERQRVDLDKQKFIKVNRFNLLRITGKLTLNEFYNLIKDKVFDNENLKALFIENNNIYETTIDKLKDTLNENSDLNVIINDLQHQVKMLSTELKNQANYFNNQLNDKKLSGTNKKILDSLDNKDNKANQVYQFMLWYDEQGLAVGTILTGLLYQEYKIWNKDYNGNITPLKNIEFVERLKNLANTFEFKIETKNKTRLSTLTSYDLNPNLLNKFYFNNKLTCNRYSMSSYIKFKNQITDEDIAEVVEGLENQKYDGSDFETYKSLLILYGLIDEMNDDAATFAELYNLNYELDT